MHSTNLTLRKPQHDALVAIKQDWEAKLRRLLIVLPTGMGKTPTFASIRSFFGFNQRCLVLVHMDELATQARDKIQRWNPYENVGIEMGKHRCSPADTFVIASVPTLCRAGSPRLLQFDPKEFDVIICDEAHHSISPTWKAVLAYFGFDEVENSKYGSLLVGVTATPGRGDKQAMGQIYEKISYQYSMQDAVRDGWLVEPRGYRVTTHVSLAGVTIRAGDFVNSEVALAVDTQQRNVMIVDAYVKWGTGFKSIAFCTDISHAKHLAVEFNCHGIKAAAIWSTDPERAAKLKALRLGEIRVLTNCNILTEGYDDPTIACVINAAPTRSQLRFIQRIGRPMRLQYGVDNLCEARQLGVTPLKEYAIVIDVVDSTDEHSLATFPTIFGLPASLDLQGKPLSEAMDEFEDAAEKYPHIDFSNLKSLKGIETYAQEVDLFANKLMAGIQDASPLMWYQVPGNAFILRLPEMHEHLEVSKGKKDTWTAFGSVRKNYFSEGGFKTAAEAIQFADSMVGVFGRGMLESLRRGSRPNRKPASDFQIGMIERMTPPELKHKIPTRINTYEAQVMINRLIRNSMGVK